MMKTRCEQKCKKMSLKKFVCHPTFKLCFGIVLFGVLLGLCVHAFAAGTDMLQGTTDDATATTGGTGKKWLYLIEGLSSIYAYHKSKNVFVFGGIVVVAIVINIILHMMG